MDGGYKTMCLEPDTMDEFTQSTWEESEWKDVNWIGSHAAAVKPLCERMFAASGYFGNEASVIEFYTQVQKPCAPCQSVRGVAKAQPRWALISALRYMVVKGGITTPKSHSWGLITLLSVLSVVLNQYQPAWNVIWRCEPRLTTMFSSPTLSSRDDKQQTGISADCPSARWATARLLLRDAVCEG